MKTASLVLALTVLLSLGDSSKGNETYSATATVEICHESPNSNEFSEEISKEVQITKSDEVLSSIITDLKLDKVWGERQSPAHSPLPMTDALRHFRQVLKLGLRPSTSLVDITVLSEDPREAADIANAVADHYVIVRYREKLMPFHLALEKFKEELTKQGKVITEERAKLAQNPSDSVEQKKVEELITKYQDLSMRATRVFPTSDVSYAEIANRAVVPVKSDNPPDQQTRSE